MKEITLQSRDGWKKRVRPGTRLLELLSGKIDGNGFPILGAIADHHLVPLTFAPDRDMTVEFLSYATSAGRDIYRQTATFILNMAVAELFRNTRLVIGNSLANGFYFDFFTDTPVNQELLHAIKERMLEIVKRDEPFKELRMTREQAVAYFTDRACHDTLLLLKNCNLQDVTIHENGRSASLGLFPLAPSTGFITQFELKTYTPGFVLLFPEQRAFSVIPDTGENSKLFHIYQESKTWGQILGVSNIGRLNHIIRGNGVSELIKIGESLHEKKIASIADTVTERRGRIRLILVAGPSASGKTTFSKKLAIHLRVNGIRPIMLSMDNYFIDRDLCPRDEQGNFDFEALEALDIPLFNDQLAALFKGREVNVPRYNFQSGKRETDHQRLRMEDDQVLIIEGIHGLNERLTAAIPAANKFKIYISALTQLLIDDRNRISTTDTRVLRRMIRDYTYRHYTASETLKRFISVKRGEEKYIFPFQESADVMFNSALVYELAVLKNFAVPLLQGVPSEDSSYVEAQRLLAFLELFLEVPPEELPPTSILREFIGGSSFSY